jgi:hypothetical protein
MQEDLPVLAVLFAPKPPPPKAGCVVLLLLFAPKPPNPPKPDIVRDLSNCLLCAVVTCQIGGRPKVVALAR